MNRGGSARGAEENSLHRGALDHAWNQCCVGCNDTVAERRKRDRRYLSGGDGMDGGGQRRQGRRRSHGIVEQHRGTADRRRSCDDARVSLRNAHNRQNLRFQVAARASRTEGHGCARRDVEQGADAGVHVIQEKTVAVEDLDADVRRSRSGG
jgi:hypothetical protein